MIDDTGKVLNLTVTIPETREEMMENAGQVIELAVTVRNSERSLTHKHLVYDSISMNPEDPTLSRIVSEAKKAFGNSIEDVIVKTKFVWLNNHEIQD